MRAYSHTKPRKYYQQSKGEIKCGGGGVGWGVECLRILRVSEKLSGEGKDEINNGREESEHKREQLRGKRKTQQNMQRKLLSTFTP